MAAAESEGRVIPLPVATSGPRARSDSGAADNPPVEAAAAPQASPSSPVAGEPRPCPPPLLRPVNRNLRFLHAYFVTFLVVASYLWLSLQGRFRSPDSVERLTLAAHLRNARRIERAIARLQGLFIKVGQLISIMTNFLPEEFRAQLAGLQDAVPARPFADIERRIREEFGGKGPRELFAEFAEQPVASASIGQVHMARTHAGQQVAVKVQYPDIEDIVRIDLRTLRRIFSVVNWFMPYHGLDGVYREIREMILQELDFRREAESISRIAGNFDKRARSQDPALYPVAFPEVIAPLSTAQVLTTAWIDGAKVSDRSRLEALGIDRARLARTVVHAYCQQIFTDGLYHADPHPGNLLVQAGGRVTFIDFGAVAEVPPAMRKGIADVLQAGLSRDTPRLINAMKDMGFIARGADPAIFDRVVDYLHERFQEDVKLENFSLKEIKLDPKKGLERLADLRRMEISLRDIADHFYVPKTVIMLERTVLLLIGLCTELDPEMNPMEVIRPYVEQFVLGDERDLSRFVVDATRELAMSALSLPGELRKFVGRAQRGDLEVRFRGIDEHARLLYTLGHQVIYAALGITSATFWLVLDGRGRAAEAQVAGWGAAAMGLLLGLSFLLNRGRVRRRSR